MEFLYFSFIDEPVQVEFLNKTGFEKSPGCPDFFIWRGERFQIKKLIAEWQDFTRRGRMARNMRPSHSERASFRGSRGVGRFYFRVQVENDRCFDLYYDRAPKNVDQKKGNWILKGECKPL